MKVARMATFKYFSYGSNLLRERILINNETAKFCGVGKLNGYRFLYDTPSSSAAQSIWYGASATIRLAEPSDYVYGVIWDIDVKDIPNLDKQEQSYNPIEVQVEAEDGQTVTCRTYEMMKETKNIHLPSPFYKEVILMGARQNGLPSEYIQGLESLPDNGVTDVPPVYLKVLNILESFQNKSKEKGPGLDERKTGS